VPPPGGRPPPPPDGARRAPEAAGRAAAGAAARTDACGDEDTRGGAERSWGARAGGTDGGGCAAASACGRAARVGRAGGGVPLRAGVTGISREDWRRMRGSGRAASSPDGRGRGVRCPLLPTAIASSTEDGRGDLPPWGVKLGGSDRGSRVESVMASPALRGLVGG